MVQYVKNNKDFRNKLIIIAVIAIQMLFCQANSPLFGYNEYQDLAIYTVIGRALRNGQVLYRDVFDHKGPIFFFLQTIIYFNKWTVWIYDIVTYAVQAIFLYKQIRLFKGELGSLAGTLFTIGCEISFMWDAGSPEQIFMMLFYIQMYLILKNDNNEKTWFIFGVIVGYIFYQKINILLGWFPAFVYLTWLQIKQKRVVKNFIQAQMPFLAMTLIVFGYFGINDQIPDFISSYFLQNAGYAVNTQKIFSNLVCGLQIAIIALIYLIRRKNSSKVLWVVALMMVCTQIGEVGLSGHVYPYYIILLLPCIQLLFLTKDKENTDRHLLWLQVSILSLSLFGIQSMQTVQNRPDQFLKQTDKDIRYQFYQDLIADGETFDESFGGVTTLYTIDCNLAYYLPYNPVKYSTFCNMTYKANPEMYDETYEKIKNKEIEYVAVQLQNDGHVMTGVQGAAANEQIDETLDAIADNYDLYKTYKINDERNLVVYKCKGE